MTTEQAVLSALAKELDSKLWELYQLAKETQGSNYLGEGNKWKRLEELVLEISKLESDFCSRACQQVRVYKELDA